MPTIELDATQPSATSGMAPIPDAYSPSVDSQGYVQWILWLKQVLPADHLVLFECKVQAQGQGKGSHQELKQLAFWPVSQPPGKKLVELAVRCMQSGSVVCVSDKNSSAKSAVCFPDKPVSAARRVQYVLLLQRPSTANSNLQADAKLASWALRSLENFIPGQAPRALHAQLMQPLLDSQSPGCDSSVRQSRLMDRLLATSQALRCQLACLKVRRGKVAAVQLLALSGQSKVDKRLAAAQAMVACIEGRYLGRKEPLQVHHEPAPQGGDALERLIIPIACENRWYAVSIERTHDKPFSTDEQKHLVTAVTMAVSMLHFSDAKTLQISAACQRCLHRVRTRIMQSLPRSLSIALGALIILVFLLFPVEHRVSAPLSVEAAQRHVLIAPTDGFVESVTAKAGDTVSKGQVLATLEDLDLQLQLQKLQSEQLHNQQAFAEALAMHDRINVTRLKEEGSLIEKELAQLEIRAQRMILTSPVDAVVLSGSWDDFLGAAVKAGETLYSLGSTDMHKLVLDVSEYDVKSVQPGQPVAIRLSADPSIMYPGVVKAIMPLAVSRPSGNSVQVHATLNDSVKLLPGMEGLGKIRVGLSPRILQWLRRAGSRLLWLGWRSGLIK